MKFFSEKLGFRVFGPTPTFRVRPLPALPGGPLRKISRGLLRAPWTFPNAVGILTKSTSGLELWWFDFFKNYHFGGLLSRKLNLFHQGSFACRQTSSPTSCRVKKNWGSSMVFGTLAPLEVLASDRPRNHVWLTISRPLIALFRIFLQRSIVHRNVYKVTENRLPTSENDATAEGQTCGIALFLHFGRAYTSSIFSPYS